MRGKARLGPRATLAIGVTLRLCLIPLPAADDMPRYVWEGRMLGLGFNPWKLAPDAPELAPYRDANWEAINHKHNATLYPPLAEGCFAALAAVKPAAWFFKLAFALCEVAAFAILLVLLRLHGAGEAGGRIAAIYFLNPLLLLETAWHGHYESLVLLATAAFLLAMHRARTAAAGLFLFLGAAAKVVTLALLPLLVLRGGRRGALCAALVAGAAAAMLALVGAASSLGGFAADYQYNSVAPYLIHLLTGGFLSRQAEHLADFVFFGVAAVTAALRLRHATLESQGLAFMGLLLVFSPTLHPWYVLWILPFAALRENRPWLLLTGTVAVSYAVYAQAAATGHWREIPWLRLPEFLPPLALWLTCRLRAKSA